MTRRDIPNSSDLLRDSTVKNKGTGSAAMILVLFDIDGTLSSSGTFTVCLNRAAEEILGIKITTENSAQRVGSGCTVVEGVAGIVESAGIPKERAGGASVAILERAKQYYVEELKRSPVKPLAGVVALLKRLGETDGLIIGIATNNVRDLAYLKLVSAGLWESLSRDGVLETGDVMGNKSARIEEAIKKAEQKLGIKFDRKDVFYFGDQISDVAAGKACGVTTVGIATGRSIKKELADAGADAVFQDLSNTEAVMAFIARSRSIQRSKA